LLERVRRIQKALRSSPLTQEDETGGDVLGLPAQAPPAMPPPLRMPIAQESATSEPPLLAENCHSSPAIDVGDTLLQSSPLLGVDGLAVSEGDWQLLSAFHEELANDKLDTCKRCQERWFNMSVDCSGVCRRCVYHDRSKGAEDPFYFSAENNLDPGPTPTGLPQLTQLEEMLIARVHVYVEVRQVRGVQYKYSGHIVNFLRDTGRIYAKLPLLPRDLDIIILRPSNADDDERLRRQFTRDFKVRHQHIRTWLLHLQQHHPGYRDITVDEQALSELETASQLPEHDMMSYFTTTVEPAAIEPTVDNGPDDLAGTWLGTWQRAKPTIQKYLLSLILRLMNRRLMEFVDNCTRALAGNSAI
jgi:hypothetical protein